MMLTVNLYIGPHSGKVRWSRVPESDPKPPVGRTLWHGVRRRCPHCGLGPLFIRWITPTTAARSAALCISGTRVTHGCSGS